MAAADRFSDADLLGRCGACDEDAWRLLVRRYQNLVYSTAREVGLDGDEAADVFQEVWLELQRSIPRIRHPEAIPRWLIVATRRLSYKVATRRRRLVPGISRDLVDPGTLPDAEIEAKTARARIEAALSQLDGKCARLLRLLFLDPANPAYEEISRQTGLAIGSIGPIRSRCLNRLRKILEENS
ncbi:MAG: sigma-70 family RNA polymerase sigma factor [bacterium]